MSDRRAERVTPKPIAGQTLCALVPITKIELAAQFVAAGQLPQALSLLQAMRFGPRRLERVQ